MGIERSENREALQAERLSPGDEFEQAQDLLKLTNKATKRHIEHAEAVAKQTTNEEIPEDVTRQAEEVQQKAEAEEFKQFQRNLEGPAQQYGEILPGEEFSIYENPDVRQQTITEYASADGAGLDMSDIAGEAPSFNENQVGVRS